MRGVCNQGCVAAHVAACDILCAPRNRAADSLLLLSSMLPSSPLTACFSPPESLRAHTQELRLGRTAGDHTHSSTRLPDAAHVCHLWRHFLKPLFTLAICLPHIMSHSSGSVSLTARMGCTTVQHLHCSSLGPFMLECFVFASSCIRSALPEQLIIAGSFNQATWSDAKHGISSAAATLHT